MIEIEANNPPGIIAMGLSAAQAASAVRLSVGLFSAEADIERAARALSAAWKTLQSNPPRS